MKKLKSKIATFALGLCLMVPSAFALTACEEEHTHSLNKVDAVAETCTTAGNTEYYKCECGKYFSDEEGKTEIEKDSWIVSATGHSFANTWKYDETHHWKEATCSHTTEKGDYAEHTLTNNECTCGYVAITYTVADATAWRNVFEGEHLNNGSLKETANTYENGVANPDAETVQYKKTIGNAMELIDEEGDVFYLVEKNDVWYGVRYIEEHSGWYGSEKTEEEVAEYSFASLASMFTDVFDEFEYDEENKCYVKENLYPNTSFKLYIENGKLVKVEMKEVTSETSYKLTEYVCYDYGKTEIELPQWTVAPVAP